MDAGRIGDVEKVFVERRDWPRLEIGELIQKAAVRLPAESTSALPSVEIVNLSEAGAGVLLPAPVERGLRVTLEMATKDIPRLDVQAEVRWAGKTPVSTGKYAAGLKFMHADAQSRTELRAFMRTLRTYKKPAI